MPINARKKAEGNKKVTGEVDGSVDLPRLRRKKEVQERDEEDALTTEVDKLRKELGALKNPSAQATMTLKALT